MEADLVSLLLIVSAAFLCPIVSALIPRKLVPETVLLLAAGMIMGPNVLDIAHTDAAINLLSDLGLGFLFLLAGYEINPKRLAGREGRYGFVTWLITFAIAIIVVGVVPSARDNVIAWFAVAIALTTTAFGTLVPILQERGITDTPIGDSILSYGIWGEICPIIAMALVLSARTTWMTLAILAVFAFIAVLTAVIPRRLWEKGAKLPRFIAKNAEANTQMTLRAVMMLLVGLLAISALFDLDIVLGSFAAGFILRFIIPEGDKSLEHKLNGIGYGFFIPLFFVVSGMGIAPSAVEERPIILLLFIAALLLIRALPIFISLKINPETRSMNSHSRATIALYCATALPIIVAVTTVAVNAGALSADTASLLVAAGGISVLIMPLGASITFWAFKKSSSNTPSDSLSDSLPSTASNPLLDLPLKSTSNTSPDNEISK